MDSNHSPRSHDVVVVGEMHQDLFYKNTFFSEIVQYCSQGLIDADYKTLSRSNLEKKLFSIVDDAPKKIGGQVYIKRGGNGNNSANLLAKLGISTSLMTTVGKGTDWMLEELQNLGIDTNSVYKVDEPGPISTIIEDPKITKIFVAPNLKEKMNFDSVTIPDSAIKDAKIIFFTPIAPKYTKLLMRSSEMNLFTAITIETQKISNFEDAVVTCPVRADLLFSNLNDAAMICNIDFSSHSSAAIGRRIVEVDKKFKKLAKIRVYTLGKYGSWVCHGRSKPINIPIISVKVKNRTGAGDTFAAGFIAHLTSNVSGKKNYYSLSSKERTEILVGCAKYAGAAGAIKVSTGNAPNRKELENFLKKNKVDSESKNR